MSEYLLQVMIGSVAKLQPDYAWWCAVLHNEMRKVAVLGNQNDIGLTGRTKNLRISRVAQSYVPDGLNFAIQELRYPRSKGW